MRYRASDDRPACRCGAYMDDAALDRLTSEDWAMRCCELICTDCTRRIAVAETRAIALAEARVA